jgi:5-methylcytosine-specific restriction endonuclease McrA
MNCDKVRIYNPSQYRGKYCSNKCQQEYRYRTETIPKILAGGAKDIRATKRYIIETHGNKCNECGIDNFWNNKELNLHLDHIDGDRKNNSIENFRLLCPNCHSQTQTYAGRNNGLISKNHVTDDELLSALESTENIGQALNSVGLAITGPNYNRCYKLKSNTRVA